jgi:phytoene/squalene synthetase
MSHPVADGLRAAITRHRLPAGAFEQHLAAREAMLTQGAFADLDTLRVHAGEVATPIVALGCLVLGAPMPRAAALPGEGLGLVALLRDAIGLARAGRLALPEDLCAAAGFGVQSVAEGRNRDRISGVVGAVADAAGARLRAARVPRPVLPALLPKVTARAVLSALARGESDPAAASAWQVGTGTRLAVLWAATTCRV